MTRPTGDGRGRVELALTSLLVLAALAIAGSTVYRLLVVRSTAGPRVVGTTEVDFVEGWREALKIGRVVAGDVEARSSMVILMDLECGACARFHAELKAVLPEFLDSLRVLYVHHPMRQNRFAIGAARAAECALAQAGEPGFVRWVDMVYASRDSLGLKSWEALAQAAALPDPDGIASCAKSPAPVPAIEAGLAFGTEVGMAGVPMMMLDGWRMVGAMSREDIRAAIVSVLAGHPPR